MVSQTEMSHFKFICYATQQVNLQSPYIRNLAYYVYYYISPSINTIVSWNSNISQYIWLHISAYLLKIIYTIWLSAEAIDLGRSYWILHPVSCHTPQAATTVSKCSWGWMQKASETCRALLQLLINILPSFIMLVFYIY